MALNFQPYQDTAGQEVRNRWTQTLDGIFEQYQKSKQEERARRALDGQLALSQQQLSNEQRASRMADITETAKFGAPLASYGTAAIEQGQRQAQPDFMGPVNPKYAQLAQGLHNLRQEASQGLRLGEAKIDETTAQARERNALAGLYERTGGGSATPEIVTGPGGGQFLVKRGLKGEVSFTPYTANQISSEVGTKVGLAQDGLANLDYIETMLKSPKGQELALKAGGDFNRLKSFRDPDAEKLANAIFQAGDAEARVKTGAAINNLEMQDYFNKLVNPVGTIQGNLDRISRKKSYFNSQMSIYGQGRTLPGQAQQTQPKTQSGSLQERAAAILAARRNKNGQP